MSSYAERFEFKEMEDIPGWKDFISELVPILDYHVSFHHRVLSLLNSELKTRPTYRQAVEHFRRNVKPENAVVKRYYLPEGEEQERKKQVQKNVKVASHQYSQLEDEKVNDQKTNLKTDEYELYVDSTYLDHMLSTMENERYKQMKHLKRTLDRLNDDHILFKETTNTSINTNERLLFDTRDIALSNRRCLGNLLKEKRDYILSKRVFYALKSYSYKRTKGKEQLHKCNKILERQFMRIGFDAFKHKSKTLQVSHQQQQVSEAKVDISDLRAQIAELNSQIQELRANKASLEDFHRLEISVDKHRAREIFNDMQSYSEGLMTEIQQRINVDKQDTVDRINDVLRLFEECVKKEEINTIF